MAQIAKYENYPLREKIINCIYNDIVDGNTYSSILSKLMNDEYGLGRKYSEDRSTKFLAMARKVIKQDYEEQRPQLREQLTATLMDILKDAKKSKDRSNALKAVEQISKLTGCNEPDKIEIKQELVIDFGFDTQEEN